MLLIRCCRNFLLVAVLGCVLAEPHSAMAQESQEQVLERLHYPPDARLLILHADDVGMSHSVNRATVEALQRGYVSSASIMVPCPWFNEAAAFAVSNPKYDFGLHLTLTSEWKPYRWRPLLAGQATSLVDDQGYLRNSSEGLGKLVQLDDAIRELRAQIAQARAAHIAFSHLDNHMGALSQSADLFRVYLEAARGAEVVPLVNPDEEKAYRLRIPPADFDIPVPSPIPVSGSGDSAEQYRRAFSQLPPGLYYMTVHLGFDDEELQAIMGKDGAASRQSDFDLVSGAAFRESLAKNHIQLVTWREIADRWARP